MSNTESIESIYIKMIIDSEYELRNPTDGESSKNYRYNKKLRQGFRSKIYTS